MPKTEDLILAALQQFAADVSQKTKALATGEPEDQLRAPFENFLAAVGRLLGQSVVAKGESQLPGRLGRPDYAIVARRLLAGYVELKKPGKGANPQHYRGHDKEQWKRFQSLPNLIYTDGNEWGLYRDGERVGRLVRLSGDVSRAGKSAAKAADANALKPLLTNFLSWSPIVPKDARALAALLAPLCRMLRQEVSDALKDSNSPLVQLASDWRQLLFPDADDDRFADAYAQTVTFALLLARSEGARTLDLNDPIQKLAAGHTLLSRALQVLTDPTAQAEIAPSLRLLQRVVDCVPDVVLVRNNQSDPWLYFYEDFLAAYDPKLRKDAGAYYTPVEVVHAQVRLIDRLLVNRLNRSDGFSDAAVVTLDPAVGTGTYLLAVIDHAMKRVADEQGPGAVPGHAVQLGQNVYGFENMVGPYAVAELRVSRALLDRGASLPKDGPGVYLTDTLESPHAQPPQAPLFLEPLADQHKRALKVKDKTTVLVCLGNPPYGRHGAADATDAQSRARTGGWVRWSDDGNTNAAIFKDFLEPALRAGHGGDVKNLYNLYVYFWRWALWKVFEHKSADGPGIVSFISAASYMDGDAFVGVREHMRRLCDEVWIIDAGGEGRGTRKTDNVFAILTPVAIAVAVCFRRPDRKKPATVHYTRIDGSRAEKLQKLDSVTDFGDLKWETCPTDWQAPFRPAGKGNYFKWPLLTDLMPWQHSGVKVGRSWPIAPDENTLRSRWRTLCHAPQDGRASLFVDRPTGRKADDKARRLPPRTGRQKAINELSPAASGPELRRYAYRSFDRQYIIADGRLIDRPGPDLWRTHNVRQLYFTTLLNHPLGGGPALTAAGYIPDLHHFRGSYGAKEAFPLYSDAAAKQPNITPCLLTCLGKAYGQPASAEDFVAYAYAILAQSEFTDRFSKELGSRELRLPLTKDSGLFMEVAEFGKRLLWLHTYGERFTGKGRRKGQVPRGAAKCTKPVSDKTTEYPDRFDCNPTAKRLTVGTGVFEPVDPDVYEFDVSGLKVVQSWLGYRMRSGRGRKSSPLDSIRPEHWTAQFTTELLQLLWILEATTAGYSQQAQLLERVLQGPLFQADELPDVPDEARRPAAADSETLFD